MAKSGGKTIVVYKSKYGTTKRYAEWLAEELQADLYEYSKVGVRELLGYDTIVFGGSLHAVGISGFPLIKRNFDRLKEKKLIVFSVGMSPAHPEALAAVKTKNFTEEMKAKIDYFHLRGGFNYAKLGPVDKVLMYMMKRMILGKKPEQRSQEEKELLASYDQPVDWTDKEALTPVLECIKA